MARIYIAGKVTGLSRIEATTKFGTVEKTLLIEGHEPINPLNIVDPHQDTWESAMRKCIAALMTCEEAHFLPCWIASPGASLELDIAKRVGIKTVML